MQRILGYIRKACTAYNMINSGDSIAVCVSGGKDSMVLLKAMCLYRKFAPDHFTVKALTADVRFGGRDTDLYPVRKLCDGCGAEYTVVPTDIGTIVFDIRKEKNPCSLCARMRRSVLISAARSMGCNKIALGHNNDDVIETFLMNLYYEGRIGCFSPAAYYEDSGITLIRPLVFAPEKDILSCARRNGIETVRSGCPANGNTVRETVKQGLREREKHDHGFKKRIFGALVRSGIDGWQYKEDFTP